MYNLTTFSKTCSAMSTSLPTILDIAEFLERWAPRSSAQSYDNVGLQVGDPAVAVKTGLIALDMTPDVLNEAESLDASLVITHHPLIFQPLRYITPQTYTSNLALRLAASGIALYSIHTNLDAASGGVSFALAETLGVRNLGFLEAFKDEDRNVGLGAVGRLEEPVRLEDFLVRAADRLGSESLRYVGDPDASVSRVAVCGGAGADFVAAALAAEADVYVTADVKYHQFFDVLDPDGRPRMAFIDAGHYETEAMTEQLLRTTLAEQFPSADWRVTATRTSPVRTFSPAG